MTPTPDAPCGLFTAPNQPVPLDGVRIAARLDGPCVSLDVTQRYTNREAGPIEAVYVFPLEQGAAICGFEVSIDDRRIVGRVDEREAAFATYDDALADGHGAFLLDQERPDVFTASVGNLKPGQTAEITIRTVSLAADEGDALRLTIPTTVSPRYVPATAPEIGQADGDRVNPERRARVPYGLTLTVEVDAGGPLRSIESPSHAVRTTLRDGGASVALSQADAALDRDFVLLVEAAAPRQPVARVAREADGTRVCMLTFAPDLTTEAGGREIQFLVDCSGSMGGDSIDQARRALELCVRALGPDDTFNITRFGSRHEALFPTARRYDQPALDAAVAWIRATDADLGGTEILAPMTALLTAPRDAERPRQVLLLTDGQVSNEDAVIALAEAHVADTRVFTFGIGAGASQHLVKGVARASRGASELIYPAERIEPKVLRMFDRVRSPALRDVRVDWGGLDVEPAPRSLDPLFAGDRMTVFARVRSGATEQVALVAGDQRWTVAVDLEHAPEGGPVPTLWARHRIRDLESASGRRGSSQARPERAKADRSALVALGTRYGLVSSVTSYVAVEERVGDAKTTEQAALRRVPIALTVGWGGSPGLVHHLQQGFADKTMAMPMAAPAPQVVASLVSGGGAFSRDEMAPRRRSRGGVLRGVAKSVAAGFGGKKKRGAPPMEEMEEMALYDSFNFADAEPAAEAPATDRVYDVLMTQRADGRFAWSPTLEAWLGDHLDAVRAAATTRGDDLVVTAVICALLARDARAREGEWRGAVRKAKAWLAAQTTRVDVAALLAT